MPRKLEEKVDEFNRLLFGKGTEGDGIGKRNDGFIYAIQRSCWEKDVADQFIARLEEIKDNLESYQHNDLLIILQNIWSVPSLFFYFGKKYTDLYPEKKEEIDLYYRKIMNLMEIIFQSKI